MERLLRLAELDEDLAKVVWVPGVVKEAAVAHVVGLVARLAEAVLVGIAHRLHGETHGKEHHAGNVPRRAESGLRVARDGGRVEDGDGQGDGPDPDHLQDPEAEEGEEAAAHVIEAAVRSRLEDAEEQEAREAEGPDYEEEGGDELAGVVVAAEGEGDDGQDGKVGAASKVLDGIGD